MHPVDKELQDRIEYLTRKLDDIAYWDGNAAYQKATKEIRQKQRYLDRINELKEELKQ